MKFSPSEVLQAAEPTGFKVEMVEKVLHLLNLLNALSTALPSGIDILFCVN